MLEMATNLILALALSVIVILISNHLGPRKKFYYFFSNKSRKWKELRNSVLFFISFFIFFLTLLSYLFFDFEWFRFAVGELKLLLGRI